MIIKTIISILIILLILYYLFIYKIEHFKTLMNPNYIPNVNIIKQKQTIPEFDVDQFCYKNKDNKCNPYVYSQCIQRLYNKSNINYGRNTILDSFFKNTPLKYDGIWEKRI